VNDIPTAILTAIALASPVAFYLSLDLIRTAKDIKRLKKEIDRTKKEHMELQEILRQREERSARRTD